MSNEGSKYPDWLEELRIRYNAGEASVFILHGNVRDLYPWRKDDKHIVYMPLQEYLRSFLKQARDSIVSYNISDGVMTDSKTRRKLLLKANIRQSARGELDYTTLPTKAATVLPILESLVLDSASESAVILDYVETIVPNGDIQMLPNAANLVRLLQWTSSPKLLGSSNVIVMITENLSNIHRRITDSPSVAAIRIGLPSSDERCQFVTVEPTDDAPFVEDMSEQAFGNVCAGLSLLQIRAILKRARHSKEAISFKTVSRRKKQIIEQECHGLVEFVDPDHDFSHVGGNEGLKEELMRVAKAIKSGRVNQVPMGMLFVGPMGTGKTYIAEAFASESGLTCLKFKNFRDKWVGSTEGNLEKILQVVNGLGYVLLIIDEADRSMNSGTDGDGGTSSRVIARIKEFMSDTTHRGRVLVMMMTNRPDKIDVDLKRPGRLDIKIPFFFPQDEETRTAILNAQVRKNKIILAEGADVSVISPQLEGFSAAELEAVMLRATRFASEQERDSVTMDDLKAAAVDVIPSRDERMLEFMEMLAVFESSSRKMLPERYQSIETAEVLDRLDQLRMQLGRRA
ncbi:MAG: ATP-binding protein [Myxococcota bacterium]